MIAIRIISKICVVFRVTIIVTMYGQNKMVDTQIDQFEAELRNDLDFQLVVHTPRRYWEELDELDEGTRENIIATLHDVFEPRIEQYKYTGVVQILTQCRDMLGHVLWAAMNVPYPRNPDAHIEDVINNAFGVYIQVFYAQLRTEMIMVNHSADVIQRTWKNAVSNPGYDICRRRLENEFKTLTDTNSM